MASAARCPLPLSEQAQRTQRDLDVNRQVAKIAKGIFKGAIHAGNYTTKE
jgi:hypothetical protein